MKSIVRKHCQLPFTKPKHENSSDSSVLAHAFGIYLISEGAPGLPETVVWLFSMHCAGGQGDPGESLPRQSASVVVGGVTQGGGGEDWQRSQHAPNTKTHNGKWALGGATAQTQGRPQERAHREDAIAYCRKNWR